MDKEELFIKRVRELANIAYQRDITTFTDFLNLNEQNILNSQNLHKLGVTVEGFGGYENAERQMVAFHPDALAFTWEYPIDCIRLEPKAVKFSEELTHRDYLGGHSESGRRQKCCRGYSDRGSCSQFFLSSQNDRFFSGESVQGKTYNGCCIENQRSGRYSRAETESDYRNMCICAPGFSDRTGFWDIQEQYRALY